MIYGVKNWAVAAGLLTVLAAGIGSYLALRPPGPPKPCRESAEIVAGSAFDVECAPGARIEIYPSGKVMGSPRSLVKCVCPRGKP